MILLPKNVLPNVEVSLTNTASFPCPTVNGGISRIGLSQRLVGRRGGGDFLILSFGFRSPASGPNSLGGPSGLGARAFFSWAPVAHMLAACEAEGQGGGVERLLWCSFSTRRCHPLWARHKPIFAFPINKPHNERSVAAAPAASEVLPVLALRDFPARNSA